MNERILFKKGRTIVCYIDILPERIKVRTGKKIKHYMNKDDYGFFGKDVSKATDERMKNIALGIVMALMNDKEIYVEVYKLNEQGGYDLIRTQF